MFPNAKSDLASIRPVSSLLQITGSANTTTLLLELSAPLHPSSSTLPKFNTLGRRRTIAAHENGFKLSPMPHPRWLQFTSAWVHSPKSGSSQPLSLSRVESAPINLEAAPAMPHMVRSDAAAKCDNNKLS
ncbi:hypothetical protein SNOG_14596 [Parastagonospora nodorum SN15]|uniref:Uncharacterized protein n=1 Tax=Phaeosphaeria nodorum (strain SN15 / ATCC MYA-4574 / FGSC 10173) TaxID=321614 RepID=Q0U186_PHANO|nr:hypothetical protein SNOG_14596 [Parastagonospora nodorum SN15]EAT78136.1 hypothetical protein SNOG_14596 [Parastagonospora nodorum SN15]